MAKNTIYTVGGTVQAGGGIYIKRQADDELLALCRKGEYAFVLSSRQVGKSSLMVRTAEQLEKENIHSVTIDLSAIGVNVTQDEWYLGILNEISTTLILKTNIFDWWAQYSQLGPAKRLANFFRDVLLNEVKEHVVLFFDEIDTTLSIPFSDDFYAALRAVYNARSTIPEFRRLSFVLIGVASPSDLISDDKRTPFNIGRRVEIKDFTLEEAKPLAQGFGEQGEQVLIWVLQYTGGHPYLTQRLCAYLATVKNGIDEENVTAAVEELFTGEQGKQDNNLQFIRDMLSKRSPHLSKVLSIYKDIRSGNKVSDDERSVEKAHLKLSGLVHSKQGLLKVRNQIYQIVFDLQWVNEKIPRNLTKIAIWSSVVVVVILLSIGVYNEIVISAGNNNLAVFSRTRTDPSKRLETLARVFDAKPILLNPDFDRWARDAFFNINKRVEQEDIFRKSDPEVKKKYLSKVIRGLYVAMANMEDGSDNTDLLQLMRDSLIASDSDSSLYNADLYNDIDLWFLARTTTAKQEGLEKYNIALDNNVENPAIYYERAIVELKLNLFEDALWDLNKTMSLAEKMSTTNNEKETSSPPTPSSSQTTISVTFTPSPVVGVPLSANTSALPSENPRTDETSAIPTTTPIRTEESTQLDSPPSVALPTTQNAALNEGYRSTFTNKGDIRRAVESLIQKNIIIPEFRILLTKANYPDLANNGLFPEEMPVFLALQAQPPTYNTVDQIINYSFLVGNTGTSNLPGPVSISDNKLVVVTCPEVNTVGDKDNNLNPAESMTCTGAYKITQADISNGSMTNTATASVGGQSSNQVNTTIQAQLNNVLSIAVTANSTSYNLAGQNIMFTYVITNTGTTAIGPTQFVVKNSLIPTLINCGSNNTTLATKQTVSCTAIYTTTAADATVGQITATSSASTPTGAGSIQPVTTTIYNSTMPVTPVSTFAPGTTITHNAVIGEWLLQISRCYGANYNALVSANPKINDPNAVFANRVTVTVPNIGSDGPIYGPPCVEFYTVVSDDNWQSIANKFNADVVVLQAANPGVTLSSGIKIKVPVNSKGGPPETLIPSTPVPQQPIRLTFPAGNPSTVTQTSNIGTPATIRYVFAASAGQILNVQLTVATNDVGLGIYAPNNAVLKQPDTVNSWSGTLAMTGDYYIDLVSSTGSSSKPYTLVVTLTAPPPPSNTERVADIFPGPTGSFPSYLSAFNEQLYFQANGNNGFGAELWKYDRGLNAASFVSDIFPGPPGSKPTSLRQYQNMLYFGANGNDGFGNELWRFNGSAWGRVNDLYPGGGSSNPMYMTEFNGELYFSANGNDWHGVELWKFNGDTSTITRVTDINQGPGNSNPSYLTVYNNILYFAATTTNGGTELWKFDGANAAIAYEINPGIGNSFPAFLAVFNNILYFSADGNNGAGTELWKFDGKTATIAADINPGPADSTPTYLTAFNNALFFGAVGNSSGFELWKFDGTTASMASNINPTGSSNPAYLAVYKNELYFQATGNDGTGYEIWKYKGP